MLRVAVLFGLVASVTAAAADIAGSNRIPEEARVILEKAEQLTVLSVDPQWPGAKPSDAFHGWKVLGRTIVADAGVRAELVSALKRAVDEHRGEMMRCFIPRHAVRAVHAGRTADVVICFECYNARVYVDGRQLPGFLLTSAPEPAFERVLAGARAPAARQR